MRAGKRDHHLHVRLVAELRDVPRTRAVTGETDPLSVLFACLLGTVVSVALPPDLT